jgi:ketosteroid isomerase-like protein
MSNRLSAIHVLEGFYEEERLYMQAGGPSAGANFDGMASTLAPDVILHQSPDLPWGGDYVGDEGFRQWPVKMSDAFDYLSVRDALFFESGDTIMISCRLVTRSRRHGNVLDYPMTQIVEVKDGKITNFRPFYWNVPHYVAAARESF